jgi:hypothetical protein
MKTANDNQTPGLTVMRIGLPLCLALTCFSGPAAAGITHGNADGTVSCDSNHNCSSDTRLPAGPGPSAGASPVNPADYGMCGALRLAGNFDSSTIARIIVGADGYYHVDLSWTGSKTTGPQFEWTCVLFTDFTGLPYDYVKGLGTYQPPPVTAKSGGKATNMIGPSDACIWAGLAGPLATPDSKPVYVFAQFDGAYTLASAQSAPKTTLETYAFCSGIAGFAWAPYLNAVVGPGLPSTHEPRGVSFPAPGSEPGVKSSRWWCYMDGVGTSSRGVIGTSAGEKFSYAGLSFRTSDTYEWAVGLESEFWYNCMGLDH